MSQKKSAARDFGVQSYCFRNFKDNPDVAAKVRQIGVDAIEICGIHADFEKPAEVAKIAGIYRDAGVRVLSIGVQTFTGQDNERNWFESAKAAGAGYISAHFKVDSFATAVPKTARLCDEYGIRIAIHNHGGYMFGGSPDILEHLLKIGGPNIGLCIDTAWAMQTGPWGGDPVKWAEQFAGRIYGVHFKDFLFDKTAMWQDVIVGTGNLNLPAFVSALEKANFNGYSVIEYEADPDNPVPALTKCVESMRSAT